MEETKAEAEEQRLLQLDIEERAQSSITCADGQDEILNNPHSKKHGSSVIQTALNMTKLCMGTGTLALPFAAEKGGLIFNLIGLALIAGWNYYCADCVIRCHDCLPPRRNNNIYDRGDTDTDTPEQQQQFYGSVDSDQDLSHDNRKPPPDGTTSYAAVAWYAAGPAGLLLVDLLMLMLTFMIVIAYEVAMISFIDDMPISSGSRNIDVIIPSVIVALLSCYPDVGFLSKFSVAGLLALALSFIVIVWQGLTENGLVGFQNTLNLWPRNGTDASSWFGIAVFGYGISPFVMNFQESMKTPKHVGIAMKIGLTFVFLAYIIISNGVMILFSPSYTFDEDDVLKALPTNSWIAFIVRLLMTFVLAMTAPLAVVPCGQIIEGKLGIRSDELSKIVTIRLLVCVLCTGCEALFVWTSSLKDS